METILYTKNNWKNKYSTIWFYCTVCILYYILYYYKVSTYYKATFLLATLRFELQVSRLYVLY